MMGLHGLLLALAASVAVLLCARPSVALAYRIAADLPEFAGSESIGWRGYRVSFDVSPDADAELLTQALRASTGVWNATACTGLELAVSSGPGPAAPVAGDGRNTVAFVDALPGTAGGDTLAFADVRYEHDPTRDVWQIVEADILVDRTRLSATGASLELVLEHELAHCAGLLHVCSLDGSDGAPDCASTVSTSLMDPRYSDTVTGPREDDVAGICALYPPTCLSTCAPDSVCTLTGCRPTCAGGAGGVCELGEHCDAGVCAPDTEPPCGSATCDPGRGLADDPCAVGSDCTSGDCDLDLGACVDACYRSECPDRHHCETRGDARLCVPDAEPLGASCDDGMACASGLCALPSATSGYCTRDCTSSCPDGFACEAVDARDICVRRAGGCSVSAPGASSPWAVGAWLLCATTMMVARRRRFRR